MRRRDILSGLTFASLGGSVATAGSDARTIGWFSYTDWSEVDLISDTLAACGKFGWVRGGNLNAIRRATVTAAAIQPYVEELVTAAPDLIVVNGEAAASAISKLAKAPSVVFYDTVDPVKAGLVRSLARPDTMATGFVGHPLSLGPRWVQLLQELVPGLRRIGVVLEPAIPSSALFLRAISDFAAAQAIEVVPIPATDRERAVTGLSALVGPTPAAVILVPDQVVVRIRNKLKQVTRQAKLPAIYWDSAAVGTGGLISYSPDRTVLPGQLAGTVDRLLRGAKPADIPVQEPVRYELAIDRRMAEAIGLTVPLSILAQADRVLE